jgi:hypothetical protein
MSNETPQSAKATTDFDWIGNLMLDKSEEDRIRPIIAAHCARREEALRRGRDDADLSRASIADFVNIHARECGSQEAPDSCAACIKNAIDGIVWNLRAKATASESEVAGLREALEIVHGHLVDLNEYWNGNASSAMDACQHTCEVTETALTAIAALRTAHAQTKST